MKIFFIITGIGLGHTMREVAIINELKKRDKNLQIKIAGFESSYNYFKNSYQTMRIYGSKFPQSSFNVNSFKVMLYNLPYIFYFFHDYMKLKKEIKKFNPDIIIVDTQPVGAYTGKNIGIKTISIYNLDLKTWDKYQETASLPITAYLQSRFHFKFIADCYKNSDLVIIPTLKKKVSSKDTKFVDPIVRVYPNELPSEKKLRRKLSLRRKPILVMLGGSKFGFSIAEKIVNISQKFDEDFIFFGYKDTKKSNVTSFRFMENFLEYLKVCKAVILISGHTALSETLIYRKPALIFPFKNYIEHYINVSEIKDISLVKYVDNRLNEKELENYITELVSEIPRLEKALKKLKVSNKGTKQAVDLILKQIH